MPTLQCPSCGANRWPEPQDPPPPPGMPEMARCGGCGFEVNITELAIQAVRRQARDAKAAGQTHVNPHLGSDFDEFMEEHI